MRDATKGVLAMLAACVIWGLSPLYFAQLKHVPATQVLCYRALWSLIFFAAILAFQGRLQLVGRVVASRQVWVVACAAAMISFNWFAYIFAIQTGQGIEASLGYYIYPLVAVLLGWFGFGERLRPAQWIAVALAGVAVVVLTAGLGVPPWIALGLAATFSLYGVIKKQLPLGPVVSVTAEVVVLAPFAVLLLLFWMGDPAGLSWNTHALLALSGPLTATPLILFSFAARRIAMATVGVVQYVNPTLQFSCAVLAFQEPFTKWHAIAFPMIWVGLAIYSFVAIRQDRVARKADSNAGTSATVVT